MNTNHLYPEKIFTTANALRTFRYRTSDVTNVGFELGPDKVNVRRKSIGPARGGSLKTFYSVSITPKLSLESKDALRELGVSLEYDLHEAVFGNSIVSARIDPHNGRITFSKAFVEAYKVRENPNVAVNIEKGRNTLVFTDKKLSVTDPVLFNPDGSGTAAFNRIRMDNPIIETVTEFEPDRDNDSVLRFRTEFFSGK
jgi:hypothetical protein